MKKLFVSGTRFVDEDGAEVLLSGINLVCKDKGAGYVTPCTEELFAFFAEEGYNVIRLGLIWDGAEPKPGKYDDAYLLRVREQALWAEKAGIYVYLDMHQDLFSSLYGDGAPEWATLSGGLPHIKGDLWSDAYFISPGVNAALDRFWENAPAADGVGLQDHFAAMWRHVARVFKGLTNLIGCDLMNEPYPGSAGRDTAAALMAAFAEGEDQQVDPEAIMAAWTNDGKKQEILRSLADPVRYRQIVEEAAPSVQTFEKKVLLPFYRKVGEAVREELPQTLLLLESTMLSNMGIPSGLCLDGFPDGCAVYAPHGYDLVVDTDHFENYSDSRIQLIFDTHLKVQERLAVPVMVGEWGAFNQNPVAGRLSKEILEIFVRNRWSHTYWSWHNGYAQSPAAEAMRRAYPKRTGGTLLEYGYDWETGVFSMHWQSQGGRTEVYHPYFYNGDGEMRKVQVKAGSSATVQVSRIGETPGAILTVENDGYQGAAELSIV